MRTSELREKYLAFFEEKGCKRWPSSSLIPDDPSMLLTSAGMVQFKPYFLQQKQLDASFIGTTSVQKCVRTTDIDIIGTTGRHLSFFEMLGNFSFGAYFKQEMCEWAFEFSTKVLGFDPKQLYFTVYLDDDETIEIWKSLGVPESHITRLGEADNFWTAGPTGPCGPCSELYYDQGMAFGCDNPNCAPGCDCDRFLEYWNLVFTQYDRQEDGTLKPLPKKNIDTGMGLERTAAILQGVQSNYDIDILRELIALGEQLSGKSYRENGSSGGDSVGTSTGGKSDSFGSDETLDNNILSLSMRICADHARAITFMIADGVLPANEGRGYVLRRLLRRAVRHGQLIGINSPFLSCYVAVVIKKMGAAYPELCENQTLIERIVNAEEERFNQTLRQGQNYLDTRLQALDPKKPLLAGKDAFELHDRYGFPIELTVEIAAEQGFAVDRAGFEQAMEEQRSRARAAAKDDAWGTSGGAFSDIRNNFGASSFEGYEQRVLDTSVIALVVQDPHAGVGEGEKAVTDKKAAIGDYKLVKTIKGGQKAQVVLSRTPFYAEMGGQLGDRGVLLTPKARFVVEDTRVIDGVYAHVGYLEGTVEKALSVGDAVSAELDCKRREAIERNHTATHLLHHALRVVLGEHVKQAGSLVASDRLRFDLTHFEAITPEQIMQIEDLANQLILENAAVNSYTSTLEEARQKGVTALFGEKYGEQVRVVEAGQNSQELCGGTHVRHTSQIGFLKIINESSVGANLRRIEAVTGFEALDYCKRIQAELAAAAAVLKAQPLELAERIEAHVKHSQELELELKQQRQATVLEDTDKLLSEAVATPAGYMLVLSRVDNLEADALKDLWDLLHAKLGENAAAVLGGITPGGTPIFVVAGTALAVQAGFDAGAIIKQIAPKIGGGGGGRPTMAQAGGKDASGIDGALAMAKDTLLG